MTEDTEATERREGPLSAWTRRQVWMDPLAEAVQGVVGGFYSVLGRPGRILKDMMHGVWPLGHPLHPALTDIPLGAWTVAVVADYLALVSRAVPAAVGDVALVVGILGAVAAAAAGYTDFHETYGQERRLGLVHGLTMTLSLLVMVASAGLRIWVTGGRPAAIALSTLGFAVALFGAYVGGHLTFGLGTMVNRHAFEEPSEDWFQVGAPDDFPEGAMRLVDAGGQAVLMVRRGGAINAISNVCSHAGGPLNEGTLEGDIVVCPWHGSRFCISDGRARGGPATFSQPAFLVREEAGAVRVRAAGGGH